jgi:hypothetical protein
VRSGSVEHAHASLPWENIPSQSAFPAGKDRFSCVNYLESFLRQQALKLAYVDQHENPA